jgi:hypothetical protein
MTKAGTPSSRKKTEWQAARSSSKTFLRGLRKRTELDAPLWLPLSREKIQAKKGQYNLVLTEPELAELTLHYLAAEDLTLARHAVLFCYAHWAQGTVVARAIARGEDPTIYLLRLGRETQRQWRETGEVYLDVSSK